LGFRQGQACGSHARRKFFVLADIAAKARANPHRPWHVDWRVPVALIVTILLQSAAAVWWAASVDGEVVHHGQEIAALKTRDTEDTRRLEAIVEQLARIEERAVAQLDMLRRIEAKLGSRP
jgi:hypothetical protein